jgi:hypothetical protein
MKYLVFSHDNNLSAYPLDRVLHIFSIDRLKKEDNGKVIGYVEHGDENIGVVDTRKDRQAGKILTIKVKYKGELKYEVMDLYMKVGIMVEKVEKIVELEESKVNIQGKDMPVAKEGDTFYPIIDISEMVNNSDLDIIRKFKKEVKKETRLDDMFQKSHMKNKIEEIWKKKHLDNK